MLFRSSIESYNIRGSDLTIEKGQKVMIPVCAIHHDSRYYYDPLKFDPSRFSPEEVKKRPSMSFIPFGDGSRNCVGMRFGLIQTKLGIATMIKNFQFQLHENVSYPLNLDNGNMLLSSFNPIKCIVNRVE